MFVEVKTRTGVRFGTPQDAVNKKKLDKIKKAAAIFIKERRDLPQKRRIDVVAILMRDGHVKSAEIIKVI